MIHELHGALQRLVHEKGRILPDDVDVRFDAPKREWISSLTRPTLNFFLFDVRENRELRSSGLQSTRGANGTTFRMPPRRFDMRYMVSAITTLAEDEHRLLWRALATLLKYSEFPDEVLTESLRALDPPLIAQVANAEDEGLLVDVWGGLDAPPRPALLYSVTVPIDLDISFTSPFVLTRTARYVRTRGDLAAAESAIHIGGIVRDRAGRPLENAVVAVEGRAMQPLATDAEGRFVIPGVDAGRLNLRITRDGKPPKLVALDVPADTYEIVLD